VFSDAYGYRECSYLQGWELGLKKPVQQAILAELSTLPISTESTQEASGVGIQIYSYLRQIFSSEEEYEKWLEKRELTASRKFLASCRKEYAAVAEKSDINWVAKVQKSKTTVSKKNLEKIRNQSINELRDRVMSYEYFQALLTPVKGAPIKKGPFLERLLKFINPFDQSNVYGADWLGALHVSGQVLKSEIRNKLDEYQVISSAPWSPDEIDWGVIARRLSKANQELVELAMSAENLVLTNRGKVAGFNLSCVFALLKSLASEKVLLLYVITNPSQFQGAKTWNEALESARST
jgi:hypothetical protein